MRSSLAPDARTPLRWSSRAYTLHRSSEHLRADGPEALRPDPHKPVPKEGAPRIQSMTSAPRHVSVHYRLLDWWKARPPVCLFDGFPRSLRPGPHPLILGLPGCQERQRTWEWESGAEEGGKLPGSRGPGILCSTALASALVTGEADSAGYDYIFQIPRRPHRL